MSLPEHIKSAIEQYVPTLEGGDWAPMERRCELAELIVDTKPRVVVEIGTFGGASAIPQGFALRDNNDGGCLYCIDPWNVSYAIEGEWQDNEDWWKKKIDIHAIHRKCMEAIWAHNLDEWIVVLRAPSQYCYRIFPEIDILLIDGNHSEIASYRDAKLYVPRVKSGGYIWCDDLDWQVKTVGGMTINSTQKAANLIEEACEVVKEFGNMKLFRKR